MELKKRVKFFCFRWFCFFLLIYAPSPVLDTNGWYTIGMHLFCYAVSAFFVVAFFHCCCAAHTLTLFVFEKFSTILIHLINIIYLLRDKQCVMCVLVCTTIHSYYYLFMIALLRNKQFQKETHKRIFTFLAVLFYFVQKCTTFFFTDASFRL